MKKINVLSLFDGIGGARVALDNIGRECNYYASEIDKYAIKVVEKNYQDVIQLGDVHFISKEMLLDIDLLIGGSPCQNLSIAGNRKGLFGKQSQLFWEYLRLLKEIQPKYFVLENVASMKKQDKDIISKKLGIDPIMINSSLLTAQQRKRLYWVGELVNGKYKQLKVEQPKDKEILLKDILESNGYTERSKSLCITATYGNAIAKNYFLKNNRQLIFNKPIKIGYFNNGGQADRIYSIEGKSICLSANGGGGGAKTGLYQLKDYVRKLTPVECERLQGFPDNFTDCISNTQRYKALGNSFTVPVIEHLLKYVPF